MSASIKVLKDSTKTNIIYPQTLATAVYLQNNDNLEDTVQLLEQSNQTIQSQIVTINGDIDTLEQSNQTISQQISTINGDITQIESSISNLNTTKANLSSPTFTGSPTAPTQSSSDNSTKLATTAFVKNAVSSISGGIQITLSSSQPSGQNNGDFWYKIV